MESSRRSLIATCLGLATAVGGCGLFDSEQLFTLPDIAVDISADINVDPTVGKGVGDLCTDNAGGVPECRFGLRCVDGACKAVGDSLANRPCILTDECAAGLYCGVRGICEAAGEGDLGAVCSTAADCQRGLVCASTGFSGSCAAAGAGDLEAACAETVDCLAGLACTADGTCGAGSVVFGLRPWAGVSCAPVDDVGAPRVYFEVPRAGETPEEFFRLPYPNDIRMKAGHIDLAGFPTPGPGLVGFDPVARIIDAIERVEVGFSTVPVVIFRFSTLFELGSVWAQGIADPPPGEPTLYFLDITPGSPGYNTRPAYGYALTDGGSRYLCPRSLSVKPSWDSPLRPETTYAVILARGVRTPDGVELTADADMGALLGAARPADATLGAAWDAYAPLRAYLVDPEAEVGADRVIAAAVFTTQAVDDVLPRLREAVRATPAPIPKALTLCDAGVVSPCDDGLTGDEHVRGCAAASGDFWELHLRLPLPVVQGGTRPYLRPEDGGQIAVAADGSVTLNGTEDVCVSLTVPKNLDMPAAGWPIAIFGHGTGGTFRSSVGDAGAALAHVTVGADAVGIAVVGWDGPMHGERRHSDLDPEGLFYNFANPIAARGNLYQGAADTFALVQAVEAFTVDAASSPTGAEIRFDLDKIAYIGHSQGATTGPLAAPYEPALKLDVWSGAGAGLVQGLLGKTQPVNVPQAVAVALQELTDTGLGTVSDNHPVMGLIQGLFDPLDPENHARQLFDSVRVGVTPQHTLHVVGRDDSYTPNSTALTFGRLMRVELAEPVQFTSDGYVRREPPVTGNVTRGGASYTAVQVQTTPGDYDGHFVMFRDAATNRQFTQFMATWVRDGVPTLVAR
ncbi:MAG: hypothetical protein CVU56_02100 [Deltaproteobacteria bacterium HGW-Deltaproteobacteria-14]|jgi:hypothetical protein|nr:MAG: hypothetical protein CVU56_02100 [Deltaproteobacteria bacterium HGW-Deltaproteobacteria-14]